MTVAWFQCESGAAGDMLLGALLDAGAPLDAVRQAVDAVGTEAVRITVQPVVRGGIAAMHAHVDVPESSLVRTWADVRALLEDADTLPEPVRRHALDVFERLARAEARVHRTSPEHVHFHEVGALDAVADVVGVCAALHALQVEDAVASPVAVGQGMTRSAHGLLPVPAPAVLELLAEAGAPVRSGDEPYELCTPTGAALLAATVSAWGGLPPGRLLAVGYGAGTRELDRLPNVLRVVLLAPTTEPAAAVPTVPDELVMETNVDDLDPRLWPAVLTRLLEAGASDAWLTPIVMKKGRPAHTLSVLTAASATDGVRQVIFDETSAIGLREYPVAKRALDRSMTLVQVAGHDVRVKLARVGERVVNAQPEFDDVVAVAVATGRPTKSVLAAAVAAVHEAGLLP